MSGKSSWTVRKIYAIASRIRTIWNHVEKRRGEMAATGRSQKKSSAKKATRQRKSSRARGVRPEIGVEDIKRMVKAPGDYEGIARKFADALGQRTRIARISGLFDVMSFYRMPR
jgi:hypothetical protein